MSVASGGRPRPTIRDVAALAGVGVKTVSRVINDEANVSAPTRERVQRAVAALRFQPHLGAGSLRRKDNRTRTVGLLLDEVDNTFAATVNRAVEQVAERHRTAVLAASFHRDPSRERALVDVFTRRRVDALILTTVSTEHSYLQNERELGTPMVFIDRPPVGLVADAVLLDNLEAARTATRHLLSRGHRRVALLGDQLEISTASERRLGYRAALAEYGVDVEDVLEVTGLDTEASAQHALRELLSGPDAPTAVFASQNLITIGAVRTLHDLGLQHQVALVGFDEVALADLLRPGITVMATDPARMGELAAERVFAQLDGEPGPAATTVVPARLVCRGSGEIPPPG